MCIYKWDDKSPDNRTNYPNISTAYKIKPKLYYLKEIGNYINGAHKKQQ